MRNKKKERERSCSLCRCCCPPSFHLTFFFSLLLPNTITQTTLFASSFSLLFLSLASFSDSLSHSSPCISDPTLPLLINLLFPSLYTSGRFNFLLFYIHFYFNPLRRRATQLATRRKVQRDLKMNHCAIQQQNAFAACEEMRNSVSLSDRRDPVVCPKPRRLGLLNSTINDHIRPLRWHWSHQAELSDSKAGTDLLDIILSKGGYAVEQSCTQVASSPPFFSGSPPSRVANPLIQDARFGDEKLSPVSPLQPITVPNSNLSLSPSSSSRKGGGCVRANFGNKPAVRIEGFDCLDRDRRNCSIPALA